jgi:hypothetical protein
VDIRSEKDGLCVHSGGISLTCGWVGKSFVSNCTHVESGKDMLPFCPYLYSSFSWHLCIPTPLEASVTACLSYRGGSTPPFLAQSFRITYGKCHFIRLSIASYYRLSLEFTSAAAYFKFDTIASPPSISPLHRTHSNSHTLTSPASKVLLLALPLRSSMMLTTCSCMGKSSGSGSIAPDARQLFLELIEHVSFLMRSTYLPFKSAWFLYTRVRISLFP